MLVNVGFGNGMQGKNSRDPVEIKNVSTWKLPVWVVVQKSLKITWMCQAQMNLDNVDSIKCMGSQKHGYVKCPADGRIGGSTTQEIHWTN